MRAAAARRSPPVRMLKFLNGRSLWENLEPSAPPSRHSDRRGPTVETSHIGREPELFFWERIMGTYFLAPGKNNKTQNNTKTELVHRCVPRLFGGPRLSECWNS